MNARHDHNEESKKNVIILVLDTFRAKEFEVAADLPTFSSLRENGATFENAFTAAPWTLPSHASLFTGLHSSSHGANAGHKHLAEGPVTLAEVFRSNGYETVAVSNNTWISEEFGFGRGFDEFRKTWQYVQSDVDLGRIARTEEGIAKLTALGRELVTGNPLVNVTNAIYGQFVRKQYDDGAKQTNEWIETWLTERTDSSPFFLFVNYLEPHLEYHPPKEFAERFLPSDISYEEAMDVPQDAWGYIAGTVEMSEQDLEILRCLYRAEIAYLDQQIGELKALLEEQNEWEDTLFVVTGDHGENIGDHGLMDHQYCLYDTLLHVPLLTHGGEFTGGREIDDLVQLTDIAPTLLDAVGIEAPEFRDQMQGRSFHPDADTEPREYAFAEYMAPQPSMDALEKRVGDLPDGVYEYDRSLRAIRSTEWKYIRGSNGSEELYNVADDPEESENLVKANPEKVAELESTLDDWLQSFDHADADGTVSMRDETKERLEDLGYLQ
ncbi:sulfatase [Natrinema ejinorense]|uniref:Sulfatase n=1 Tax=Natrinema ejinorense TaxID=373386 RepID=A0A2A5QUE1_9EURY|nr:sulfatase [Natrinema ejinorense]PCR90468.1 sulfatase [Natrinema ejinorense]